METALRSLDSGAKGTRSDEYVWGLVDARFDEYSRIFGVRGMGAEEARNFLVDQIEQLLEKLEKELIAGSGSILLRKRIDQELSDPEYSLWWLKAELQGGMEWARKTVRSSMLIRKQRSILKSIRNILFFKKEATQDDFEEKVEHAFRAWRHQYESSLTESGKDILYGYLKACGRDSIERRILQNKRRLHEIIGHCRTYHSR